MVTLSSSQAADRPCQESGATWSQCPVQRRRHCNCRSTPFWWSMQSSEYTTQIPWPSTPCFLFFHPHLCPHFPMEAVASITAAVQPGAWTTSLDLTDTYFNMTVTPWFRKYLCFVVNSQVWQFQALLFRLSTAFLVCTHLLAPLSIRLHACGILFHSYLDDHLIRAPTEALCWSWTRTVLSLLYSLGLGVNREKSEVALSQDFVYVGVCF